MQKQITVILLSAICCSTSMADTPEVNINPGLWEWTTEMNIPNMPKQMRTTKSRKCLTKENFIPTKRKPGQECDIKDLQTSKDRVTWAMTCKTPRGPVASVGKMFYNGDTAHGEVKVNAQSMFMTSQMSGRRIGPCEEQLQQ